MCLAQPLVQRIKVAEAANDSVVLARILWQAGAADHLQGE